MWLEDCCAPYIKYHPSWRGSESEGDPQRFWPRTPTRVGAGGQLLPLGRSQKPRRGECEDALPQTSNRRVGEMGDLESSGI